MPARKEVATRYCIAKGCGMPLIRKRYGKSGALEQPSRYAARKTCGSRCKGKLMSKPVGTRCVNCRQCGTYLAPKVFPCGAKENRTHLKARKFCDAECAALYADERGLRVRSLNWWRHKQNKNRTMQGGKVRA